MTWIEDESKIDSSILIPLTLGPEDKVKFECEVVNHELIFVITSKNT